MDKARQAREGAAEQQADKARQAREGAAEQQAMAAEQMGACPRPVGHYLTEVNKKSINMASWQAHLNEMYGRGYRLVHVFEQDGNTVQVFEHHIH